MSSKVDFRKFYIIAVAFAFSLLFFANEVETPDGELISTGLGKLFYIPCAAALVFSLFIKGKADKFDRYIVAFMVMTFLSSFATPPQTGTFFTWSITRFTLGILCFWRLRDIDFHYFVKVMTWLGPVVIVLHYILTDPFSYGLYRYSGFYGDPNYLALAFNFIILFCYYGYWQNEQKIVKIICILTIVGAIPLILVGLSRAGILGLVFVLLAIWFDLFKRNKKLGYVFLVVGLLFSTPIYVKLEPAVNNAMSRFTNSTDSDRNSAYSRVLEIESVYNIFSQNPLLIPLGVGIGNNMAAAEQYKTKGYVDRFAIHNTFFKVFFEQGLFAAIIFIILFVMVGKMVFRIRNWPLIGLYIALFITNVTLGCITFMPFWIIFFLMSNKKLSL